LDFAEEQKIIHDQRIIWRNQSKGRTSKKTRPV
jgi:hypothetical protein